MKCLFPFFLFLFSCTPSQFDFVELDEFKMEPKALMENEKVEILYCSGEPDYNPDHSYYLHYIVISQESGDTVNVLSTTLTDGISAENRIFWYNREDSYMNKAIHNLDQLKNHPNGPIDFDKMTVKHPYRVVTNNKLDWSGPNQYPTVTGVLVTLIKAPTDTSATE